MPPTKAAPSGLLLYLREYGVLICRECQYAIQKSALRSHLLRHKIYRDERERLLSSVARFQLYEPDEVPLPDPGSPTISALPLVSGFRCKATKCGHLCASEKRMKRHWSDDHGRIIESASFASFARPATLQTFFRGNKLKYFEVAASYDVDVARTEPMDLEINGDGQSSDDYGQASHVAVISASPSVAQRDTPPSKTGLSSAVANLDLDTLTYFHYYITVTSISLPCPDPSKPMNQYWQHDVVDLALRQRWLMCGLLAISAFHLAILAETETSRLAHREHSAHFYSEFVTECTKRRQDAPESPDVHNEDIKIAAAYIGCVMVCAHWPSAGATLGHGIMQEADDDCPLHYIIATIRGFAVKFSPETDNSYDSQEDAFAHARDIFNYKYPSATEYPNILSSRGDVYSFILDRLRELPSRMAEVFGDPDNIQDVVATLSATATLVRCCDEAFATDETGAVWRATVRWLTRVTERFDHMVHSNKPAALVVLAHWTVIVKRAEDCGCCFLKGCSGAILLDISDRLSAECHSALSLIEGLLS
ncbi:hypothetical protein K491DRAFT_610255 [Lophiostoma macrostomum CBS 122681]|uniref:C2H2-type domain-containing protein n=1 Tax=Lophiostoma macrostomum CBS 122681 TaxID=1314788 RepID=A0A6A6STD0_9PLEO|nr:hypothetical protein K491DRAFT_610255 [Lophiostoma macrostomum CBS 122681]